MPNEFEINDILEVSYQGQLTSSGRRWNTVRHYRITENLDTEMTHYDWLTAVGDVLGLRYAQELLPLLTDTFLYNFLRIQRIAPTNSVFAISSSGAGAGAVLLNVDEPDDAAVITFRTDQPSKRFMGRVYQAGIPDTDVASGLLTETAAEDLWTAWEAMRVPVAVSGVGTVVMHHWSPTNYAQTANAGQSGAPIIGQEVDRIMRRQVRRDYPGRNLVTTGGTG